MPLPEPHIEPTHTCADSVLIEPERCSTHHPGAHLRESVHCLQAPMAGTKRRLVIAMGLTFSTLSLPLAAQQIVVDGPGQSQTLPPNTVIDSGDAPGSLGVGLHVSNGGQVDTAGAVSISTGGDQAVGLLVDSGSQASLDGGSIRTAGKNAYGTEVTGSSLVELDSIAIDTQGINGRGVFVGAGGTANLGNTHISTHGDNSEGLLASGAGASISSSGGFIQTDGISSYGASASAGGELALSDNAIITGGKTGYGLLTMTGGTITSTGDLAISTRGDATYAVYGYRGGQIDLEKATIRTQGADSHGVLNYFSGNITLGGGSVDTQGENARGLYAQRGAIAVTDTAIRTEGASASAAETSGGSIALTGGTVSTGGDSAHGLFAIGAGSLISANGTAITTQGAGANGAYLLSSDQLMTLSNLAIEVSGANAHGVFIDQGHGEISASSIAAQQGFGLGVVGVDSRGESSTLIASDVALNGGGATAQVLGSLEISDASIDADNARGLLAYNGGSIDAARVQIATRGQGATGASAYGIYKGVGSTINLRDSGIVTEGEAAFGVKAGAGASARLSNTNVTTQGEGSAGLYASGQAAGIVGAQVQVATHGDTAHGLFVENGGRIEGSSLDVVAQGIGASAIHSRADADDSVNSVALDGGAFSANQAAAISVESGELHLTASNGTEIGRAGGLLIDLGDSARIDLVADGNVALRGEVSTGQGARANLQLSNGSSFFGAAQEGASLSLDATSTWVITESSDLASLESAGVIAFDALPANARSASPVGFHSLTVQQFKGNGGVVGLNTYLGGDDSPTDRIVIDGGSATGSTGLKIINQGGPGAQTSADGIKVVDAIQGATTEHGAFQLLGDFVTQDGQQAVVGGAYAYTLHRGGLNTPNENWYLRSDLTAVEPPVVEPPVVEPPVIEPPVVAPPVVEPPVVEPPVVEPPVIEPPVTGPTPPENKRYSPGVPLYETYLQSMLDLNRLPTLQQRVGDRYWSPASGKSDTGVTPLTTDGAGWIRVERSHQHAAADVSTSGTDTRADLTNIQAGVDGLVKEYADGRRLFAGINLRYGSSQTDVASASGDGNIDLDAYGFGATVTGTTPDGLYVDGQASVNWFRGDLHSDSLSRGLTEDNAGFGYAVSAEMGKRVALDSNWTIIPQAQLTYSQVTFSDFHDIFGAQVEEERGKSLLGRAGVALDRSLAQRDARQGHVYGILNLNSELLDGTRVEVADTSIDNRPERLSLGAGVGGSYSWAADKYSVYGELNTDTALSHSRDNHSVGGTIGLRIRW